MSDGLFVARKYMHEVNDSDTLKTTAAQIVLTTDSMVDCYFVHKHEQSVSHQNNGSMFYQMPID